MQRVGTSSSQGLSDAMYCPVLGFPEVTDTMATALRLTPCLRKVIPSTAYSGKRHPNNAPRDYQ